MNKIIGIILIIVGGFLIFKGVNRQDSLAGKADSAGSSIANSVDGGNRTPTHTVWIIGGAVVAVAGLAIAARRSSAS
jgi:uncharacterized protein (UPF0333 family)